MARIFDLQLPTPTRAVHSADAETSAPSGGVVARSCQKAAHAGKQRETLSAFPLSQRCVCVCLARVLHSPCCPDYCRR